MAFRIAALLLILGVRVSFANEVAPPPLTEKGLLGRWEGAGLGLDYWFRMDLFPGGGYLVIMRPGDHDIFKLEESKISDLVREHFKMTPRAIIESLNLRRPIFKKTAAYGHFGRNEPDFTWEATDKAEALREAAGIGAEAVTV